MPPKLIFDDDALREAVATSTSYWSTARKLRPIKTDGIYRAMRRRIRELELDTSHFTGTSAQPRTWTDEQLLDAVKGSTNVAQVIRKLGLIPAGGNYEHVQRLMRKLALDTTHFTSTGQGWAKGMTFTRMPIERSLVANRPTSSHTLKLRLFRAGLKQPRCELCGWAQVAPDGRIPVELDHINGDKNDNRLENLRILCPNCHSLQSTHRGLNKKTHRNARSKASDGRTVGWCVARDSNPQARLRAGIFKTPEYTVPPATRNC